MPEVHALLFAERVIREAGNNRTTIVGIFDYIDMEDARQASTPWFVYIAIAGLPVGETKLELNIHRRGGERDFQGHGNILVPEEVPNKVECGLPITVFDAHAGFYDVSLRLDGELMATRPLFVRNGKAESNVDEATDNN